MRKGILIVAAIALLATSAFTRRGAEAAAPGKSSGERSEPVLDLPPPPVPQFGPIAPEVSESVPTKVQPAAPQIRVTPKKVEVPVPAKSVPARPAAPVAPQPIPAPVAAPTIKQAQPVTPRVAAPVAPRAVLPPAAAPPVAASPVSPPPARTTPPAPPAFAVPAPAPAQGEWKILIRPEVYKANDPWEYVRTGQVSWNEAPAAAPPRPATAAATGDAPPAMSGPHAAAAGPYGHGCNPWGYKAAYAAVPFSRAEYEANPAYRHEAAMELLFGQLRPMTVVKQTQPYFSRYPDLFRYRHAVYPYLAPGSNTMDVNYYWNYPGYW